MSQSICHAGCDIAISFIEDGLNAHIGASAESSRSRREMSICSERYDKSAEGLVDETLNTHDSTIIEICSIPLSTVLLARKRPVRATLKTGTAASRSC